MIRRWTTESDGVGRGGLVGLAVVTLSSLLAHPRSTDSGTETGTVRKSDSRGISGDVTSQEPSYLDGDSERFIPNGARNTRRLLPALASVGLAVGITGHIQRQRAALLTDAPISAKLQRPTAGSLSTAVALFERARADLGIQPEDQHLSRLGNIVIPLGINRDQLVSLQVAPGETVSIDSNASETDDVLRHVINTLSLAPWNPPATVIAHGFKVSDVVVSGEVVFARDDAHAAHEAIAMRSRYPSHTVVIVTRQFSDAFVDLTGHGVMVIGSVVPSAAAHRVVRRTRSWEIQSTGQTFEPYGLSISETTTLRETVHETTKVDEFSERSGRVMGSWPTTTDTSWHTMVRVLGPVHAVRRDDEEIMFRKSKSLELLCWLVHHRERPTVSGARTAIWDVDVQDATFHNVLSELRRGLSVAGLPNAAGRTNRQLLFIDDRVITDGDVLRNAISGTTTTDPRKSLSDLRSALSYVSGLPFADSSYAWADAEGITSTLVWLTMRVVRTAAVAAVSLKDRDALLEVTSSGLRMMSGDEELIALRTEMSSFA